MSYDGLDPSDNFNEGSEELPVEPTPTAFSMTDLGGLSLDVTFDFSPTRMTLQEISQISPGQTLDAPVDLAAPITISVDGEKVGEGDLVRIGERVCVQVTRWQLGGFTP